MSQKLRIIIPLALLGAAGVAYAAHVSAGTLSAFGWESISLICPIGALGTMLASKMLVPRAVISIVLAVAAILLLGRAFCGWLCPVPVWSKLRGIFKRGWGGRAPLRRREARPENLLRRRMLLLRRPQAGRFAPHHPGRHPAFRGHLRVSGVLPRVPRGPFVRPGVLLIALFGGRCHLVGAHHSRVDSRRGDLLPQMVLASVPHLVVHEPHRSRQSHVPAGHRRCEVPGDFPWCHLRALRRGVRGGHQPAPSGAGHYLQRVHPLPRLRRRVPRACHQLPAYRPQDSRRPGAGANAGWGERHTGHRV